MDDKTVQGEQVSQETASQEAKVESKAEARPQPFTAEQQSALQEMLKQLAAEAEDRGARKMQGIKDREVAQYRRQAEQAQGTSYAIRSKIADLDPDVQKELELAELRQFRAQMAQEVAQRQQLEAMEGTIRAFEEQMAEHVKELGVDPNDKRIEWGDKSTDLITRQKTILSSAGKIVKEQRSQMEKTLEKKLQDFESEFRVKYGLESDKAGAGVGATEGDQWLKDFAEGKIPATKENLKKAQKITGMSLPIK